MNLSGRDIFGLRVDDYAHLAPLAKSGALEGHLKARARNLSVAADRFIKPHSFDVDFTELPRRFEKMEETGTPLFGVLTDSIEAINSQVKEVLYLNDRFRDAIPIQEDIEEGAASHAYQFIDYAGHAGWLDAEGTAGGSPRVSVGKESTPMRDGGEIVQFNASDLRTSMKAGIPLRQKLIRAGVQACLNFMETVALNGDDGMGWKGFLNQTTGTASGQVKLIAAAGKFSASTGEVIRKDLVKGISALITDSKEIIPRQIRGQLCITLPPVAYDYLTNPLGDNSDKTVMDFIGMNNPWSARTTRPIKFTSLEECNTAGASNKARAVISVMDTDVHEFPVSIMPRARQVIQVPYGYQIPLEFKIGGYWLFRNWGLAYIDGV